MRMSRICVALPFIVLTAFLGGCATYSVHPFYKPDEDTLEPGLVGMWAVEDTKITIQANKGGTYEAVFANSSSHGDCPYEVRPVSYTHLDVYKRQSLISIICSMPFAPSFTGTPTNNPVTPYSPSR